MGHLSAIISRCSPLKIAIFAFGVFLFCSGSTVLTAANHGWETADGPGPGFDSTGLAAGAIFSPPPTGCNDPLVGKGAVIDNLNGGLACLLCGNSDLQNLIDGDLSNYSSFNAPVSVLVPTSVVSIKDANVDYTAGLRAGFVIQPQGGVLSVNVGGPFQIRTYLNNTLQQTVTGSALTVQNQGLQRRVSFVTSQAFDEIELLLTSTLGALTSVRVYYAYVEDPSCDYTCVKAVVPPSYAASIDASLTGVIPICVLCSVTNTALAVDSDTTNFANIHLLAGVGGGGALAVKANTTFPAGYEAGFAIRSGTGLINLTLLGATRIETYLAGVLRDSATANTGLANISLLGASDVNLVSLKTTQTFDEIRVRVQGISVLVDVNVFYAFVRLDSDNDGFFNCVDKCPGSPDYLDADGDGTPDGCDAATCSVNAGLDISTCPSGTTAQLTAAGVGQSWSALAGNPTATAINSGGVVSGLSAEGTYGFVLIQGTCRDTAYISRFASTLAAACNNPITGPKVIVTNPGGGTCLLCATASVTTNGSLSDFVTLNTSTSIIGATTLLAVRDTSQVYPAGERAGFVVQPVGGLLNATLLTNLRIRTYLNGTLQETATTTGNVLTAGALSGDGALQRLSFVTTLPFNEIELVATSTLNLLTEFRVYYAFEEPGTGCPALDGESCAEKLNLPSTTYCGQIAYARTGLVGIACVACAINNIGNLVDGDASNFTNIHLTVGVSAAGQVSVYSRQTIPAGYTAGYVISGPVNLLDATVLGGLRLRTFLNGVQQEEKLASGGLLTAQVLDNSTGRGQLSFVTALPFNEVQLRVDGLVGALSDVNVYAAFVRRDSDGDGAPDCADKCCGGDDDLDTNGNGVPNSCDPLPVATDDLAVTTNEDTPVNIPVLANDSFGPDGPGTPGLQVVTNPAHGTAAVNNNGTPANPLDDYIVYTPAANYNGTDAFTYRIIDSSNDYDTALVSINVLSVDDLPSANDDTATLNEDAPPTNIIVLINDNFGGDGASGTTITITVPPAHGMATVNNNGTPTNPTDDYLVYTPTANYNGTDQLTYQICDADGDCDPATVSFTINSVDDFPQANNDLVTLNEDAAATNLPVLSNDNFGGDGPSVTAIMITAAPTHGLATVNNNGTPANPTDDYLVYMPAANFNGVDHISYQICDADGDCNAAVVTINVLPVDDQPLAGDDAVMVNEDAGATVFSVTLNDDFGGDGPANSAITITGAPGHGMATVNNNGTPANPADDYLVYMPAANYHGADQIIYQICDADGDCDQATVNITVNSVNDLPLANNDTRTLNEDAGPTNILVLANDNFGGDGPSNTAITITIPPSHGTATVNNNGTPTNPTDDYLVYIPAANFNGADQLSYQICDADGDCDPATVNITVNPVDDLPLAVNDAFTLNEDAGPTSIPVTANDDFGGDGPSASAITITNPANHGTATVNNNGTPTDPTDDYLTYTPAANYNGPDQITYRICDANGDCDQAVVNLTVTAVDDLPMANDDTRTLNEDGGPTNITVLTNDNFGGDGPANSAITITVAPSHGLATVNNNGTPTHPTDDRLTYTPAANYNGPDQITYQICDADGDCDVATVNITVNSVDDFPVANDDAATLTAGAGATNIPVLANDNFGGDGAAGAAITISIAPIHGMASVNDNGTPANPADDYLVYTPNANYSGTDQITYQICDADGDCDAGLLTLTINGQVSACNDPITGKGTLVDEVAGTCLLCGNADLEDLTDGDLSNFTVFNVPLSVLTPTSVVSIKDVQVDYASGERVGYVIEPVGGPLSASVLGGFQLRTYLNNTLQETVTGGGLTVQEQGNLRRLSFVTTQAYDEVELLLVDVLGALTSVRVYYAFGEPASGCDYACVNAVVPPAYAATINAARTGIFGTCILCAVNNENRIVNSDTTDFGQINLVVATGGGQISVKANELIPAGYDAGFAVSTGIGGLLDLGLLGSTTIRTFRNDSLQETIPASGSTVSVSLLGGSNVNLINFKTTQSFDEIQIRVSGIIVLMDVYYAFVRPDDDADGFANCVDKCPASPDYLDADGDGLPDGCDAPVCMLNAGLDISTCPPAMDAQLVPAGPGQSWSALPGNPAMGTVNAGGMVGGLSAEGAYGFVLTQGVCHDTVFISHYEATLDAACNNPISGPKVIVTNPGGGSCLLCLNGNIIIDSLLSNSVALNTSTTITGPTTLLAVRDTSQVYPAGERTGFVVQTLGAPLSATVLSNLEIRTYLNGTLQETATIAGNVLTANAFTGNGALQRLSFITTLPFNEVELVATSTLNLLTGFKIYYAFEEPSSGCSALEGELCAETLNIPSKTYCGQVSYDHTGLLGPACVGCSIHNIGNLVDGDTDNFTSIQLTAGVGASAQVSVFTRQTIPAGYTAGFVVSGPPNLLDATVLGGLRVRTFLNGVLQEEVLASGGLLTAQVLNATTGLGQLSFVTSLSFDEVQLRVDGLVAALADVWVYYAFVRRDTDGDGAPDCADKCCGGDDNIDTNGNGVPNFCDPLPVAVDDLVTTNEDLPVNILVLVNDNFGDDGPGNPALGVVTPPAHGTLVLNNNGTPAILTDDYLVYTPALNYNGSDTFRYRICDSSNDCDTATVNIDVLPGDDLPVANDDLLTIDEDAAATTIPVLTNDNFGGDGPATAAIMITMPPTNGLATVNNNGTPSDPTDDFLMYTPAPNYNGHDQITYQICDADGDCDPAVINITVNSIDDLPVADDDLASLNEDAGATNIPVLTNDNFGGDGPGITAINITVPPLHGIAVVNDNGTPGNPTDDFLTYTPAADYNGPDQLTYQICDADGDCDLAVVSVTVNPVDDLPMANDDLLTLSEDATATTVPVLSNDLFGGDGPATSAIIITVPPLHGMATVNNNGTPNDPTDDFLLYTPAPDYNGTDQLTYQICDADGDCDLAVVRITVNAADDFPTAGDDMATLNEDAAATTIPVLANDNFGGDGPAGSAISITVFPSHGTVVVNDNGSPADPTDDALVYTPAANYNGPDQIGYQLCDADGDCDAALVNITVNPVNDAPIVDDETVTTNEDLPVNGDLTDAGDSDPDGTALTANPVPLDAPDNGSIVINPDGTYTYTPNPDFNGTDLVVVAICDAGTPLPALCVNDMIFITVNPVNDTPVVDNELVTTFEDVAVSGDLTDSGDTDPDGTSLTATTAPVDAPDNGSIVINPNGTYTYTPNPNFTGTDLVVVAICDAGTPLPALCVNDTIFITVNPVNDPPLISQPMVTLPEDSTITFCPMLSDPDAGSILVLSICGGPQHGTVTVMMNCVTYVPGLNFSGADTVCLTVCDQGGLCDSVLAPISVTPVNDAPLAVDDTQTTQEDLPVSFNPLANDTDADNNIDPASVTIPDPPNHGMASVNPVTGVITYVPDANFTGNDTLHYAVCDLGSPVLCDTAIVLLAITADPVAKLQLKLMLQGALTGGVNGLMRDDLRAGGYLPLTEPYTALANPRFTQFGGGGGESTTLSVLNASAATPNAIVDWVFVELRSTADSTVVIQTRSALVQRDGDVVSAADGVSMLTFPGKVGQAYFVAVKHRNHLGVMTATPVVMNNDSTLVDFIHATNAQVYNRPGSVNYDGYEMVTVQNKRALWTGNANANNKVKYQGAASDNSPVLAQVLAYPSNTLATYNFNNAFGYFSGDVNLDGKVKYQGSNNDVTSIFVNVVGLYTALNTLGLYNYDLLFEQLPN